MKLNYFTLKPIPLIFKVRVSVQMPRICAKVEGKGNGIKTVIVNMPEVAKALGRPATCEYRPYRLTLSCQTYKNCKK